MFSSRISQKQIIIAPDTPYEQTLKAIVANNGGNDKSGKKVQTLFFGCNGSALIGTALSPERDPHVTKVIDNNAYLTGISITILSG